MTYARVRFSQRRGGPSRAVRLVVDAGSFYSILPRRTLSAMGVEPEWTEELILADGRAIERAVGRAYVHYRERSAETWVVFGERGDDRLLGVYALEGLRLEVDPVTERLRPKRKIPMLSTVPAVPNAFVTQRG